MRDYIWLLCCWFCALGQLSAQAEKAWDRKKCGCDLDKTQLNDSRYLQQLKGRYSPTELNASFYHDSYQNSQVVEWLNALNKNLSKPNKKQWLPALNEVDAGLQKLLANTPQLQVWAAAKQEAENQANKLKPLFGWIAYSSCVLTEQLHLFYTQNPEKAPQKQQKFYKSLTQKPSNNPFNSAKLADIRQQIASVPMLYVVLIAAGCSLLSFLLAWLVLRPKQVEIPSPVPLVLEDERFNQKLASLAKSIEKQLNQAFQAINAHVEEKIQTQPQDSGSLQALESKINAIPVVNVQFIENFLTDIDKRMKKLEELPKTKDGFVINSADLLLWIEQNKQLQDSLRTALQVDLLHDTIVRLKPEGWGGKELAELDKETIARFWRIYELKEEFLPKFKKQLIAEVERAINQILNAR